MFLQPEIQTNNGVPLPTGIDIIRVFIALINEKHTPEAVSMLSPTAAPDETSKQAWGVTFNAFSSLSLTTIDAYDQSSWTDMKEIYKVVLHASLKPTANILWDEGENTRWITVEKINDVWKVSGVATGP